MCTVGLYVSLCLMIFLCPFLHCKALRTAMYKREMVNVQRATMELWMHVGGSGFVRFFWTKNSRTFQGLSRTFFPFFKDSTHCKIKGCSASHSSDCAELTDR